MLITLARKPLPKGGATVIQTCLAYGTGALNIDACRVGTGTGAVTTVMVPDHRSGNFGQDTAAYKDRPKLAVQRVDQGRWPANVLVTPTAADGMDVQSGFLHARGNVTPTKQQNSNGVTGWGANRPDGPINPSDAGGASRFFKKVGADPC